LQNLTIELTPLEAQKYAEGLVHLTSTWYRGAAHNKFLLQKHINEYNALRELIGKLNDAVRSIQPPADEVSVPFDINLAKENDQEAEALGPDDWDDSH
jgi:hypothetical protein